MLSYLYLPLTRLGIVIHHPNVERDGNLKRKGGKHCCHDTGISDKRTSTRNAGHCDEASDHHGLQV